MSKKTLVLALLVGLCLVTLPALAGPPASNSDDGTASVDSVATLTAGPADKAEAILSAQAQQAEEAVQQAASCGLVGADSGATLGSDLPLMLLGGESLTCTVLQCRQPCIFDCRQMGCATACIDVQLCECDCICQ